MQMPTNVTLFQQQVNLLGVAQAANTYTDGLEFLLILVAIYAVTFVIFKKYDTKIALYAMSFIGLLFGIFTFILDLNTEAVLITQIIIFIFAFVIASWRGDVF
jgi:hypothetical protein